MKLTVFAALALLLVSSAFAVSVRYDLDVVNATDISGVQAGIQWDSTLSFVLGNEGTFLSEYGTVSTITIFPNATNNSLQDALVARLPVYANQPSINVTNATISIDYSTTINTVPSHFYGAVVTGANVNGSQIYPTINGPVVYSDFLWHQQKLAEANINFHRADMGFECVMPNSNRVLKTTGGSALCNANLRQAQVKQMYDNGGKFLLIAAYVPKWLSTNASNCVGNTERCMPSNLTTWGEIVVQYIDYVTLNGTYADAVEVEVWNEAYLNIFFLPNGTKEERAQEYSRLYNATYSAIKAKYPNMKVGGPVATYDYADGPYFGDYFFNVTDPTTVDFVSVHEYGQADLDDDITRAMSRIRAAGFGNKPVYLTEFNSWDPLVNAGQPDNHLRYLSDAYIRILNTEPQLKTTVMYQWQEPNTYDQGSPYFAEHPKNFNMVSEPKLDNETRAGFNVTRDFGDLYPVGSSVVNSSSQSSRINVIAGTTGSSYSFSFTDSLKGNTSVSVNLSGVNAASVTDIHTGATYAVVGGSVFIGNSSQATRHFVVNTAPTPSLGRNGSGTLLSLHFLSPVNATNASFNFTNLLLADSAANPMSTSIVVSRIYNDGVLYVYSAPINISVPNNSTNNTNVTIPSNSTNVTLPVDNSTNITAPVNVTLPVENVSANDSVVVAPPAINGGGSSRGGYSSSSSAASVVVVAASEEVDERPPLVVGSGGVRSGQRQVVEKSSAPLIVAASTMSILLGYAIVASLL